MKRFFIMVSVLILAALVSRQAAAASPEDKVTSAVPDSVREMIGSLSPQDALDTTKVTDTILDRVIGKLREFAASALKNGISVLICVIICSLAQGFAGKSETLQSAISCAGAAAVTAVSLTGAGSAIRLAGEAVNEIYTFSNVLLPVLATAAAGAGSLSASAAKLAASTLFMDILISLGNNVVLPLIYAYIAASAASAAFGGVAKGAAKLLKWAVNSLLTATATAFTIYLTVTGIVASSADAATVKVTKTAISNMLPLVGKLVSDAADSIASGFSVLSSTLGVFGMIVTLATVLVPALRLTLNALIFKASAALSEAFTSGPMSSLVSDIGTALSMALALAGTSSAMLFISVISAIRTVT